MKTSLLKKIRGFTLIELLVVIAIIALLTGIVMTNLTGSKAKARDAKRVSDLGQIQLALELFFDRCKQYPVGVTVHGGGYTDQSKLTTGLYAANGACSELGTTPVSFDVYLSKIPTVPSKTSNGKDSYDYVFYTDPSTGAVTKYHLGAQLETTSAALRDDADFNSSNASNWSSYGFDGTDTNLIYDLKSD